MYIVSYHTEAHRLNQLLLNGLDTGQQIQYYALDYEEDQILQGHTTTYMFSRVTNLPDIVTLAIEAKVIYLTNTLLSQEICNGSCEVITAISLLTYAMVAFSASNGIKVKIFVFTFLSLFSLCYYHMKKKDLH